MTQYHDTNDYLTFIIRQTNFSVLKKQAINVTAISYNGSVGNNVVTFVTKSFKLQTIGYTGDLAAIRCQKYCNKRDDKF